jgi:dTMP kinase
MNQQLGIFITVEGSDGAGKGSNIEVIRDWFESRSRAVVLTREPGGTQLGEKIRNLLLDKNSSPVSAMAELLLMFAARAQHIEEVIQPALTEGRVVISDRFTDASFAYQGGGRGLTLIKVEQLKILVQADLQPDLTLLLDVPVNVGLARIVNRGESDRFDTETLDFKTRVRESYLQLAKNEPNRIVNINADRTLESVQQEIKVILEARFFDAVSST